VTFWRSIWIAARRHRATSKDFLKAVLHVLPENTATQQYANGIYGAFEGNISPPTRLGKTHTGYEVAFDRRFLTRRLILRKVARQFGVLRGRYALASVV
jgi:hypothetical protein